MRTVIIGAGIGGLAAAVALRRVGIEALVIERVPAIREVGAGLTLWSNAVNALRELALEAEVMASASLVERTITRARSGRLIAQTAFSALTREVGAPCILRPSRGPAKNPARRAFARLRSHRHAMRQL